MSKREGSICARLLSAGDSPPLRYLPDSQPPASGLQGITPMPYLAQTGSTSASTRRTSIEYWRLLAHEALAAAPLGDPLRLDDLGRGETWSCRCSGPCPRAPGR